MLPTAFALLVAIAGWYYMFYSTAAHSLHGIESDRLNRRRIRLRRIGGLLMFLLAGCFYAGFNAFDATHPPKAYFYVWIAVFLLLIAIVVLGLIDLGLTWKLRQSRHRP